MKLEKLLVTSKDEVGPYVSVEDWIDTTIQIASSEKGTQFKGTILIEGTLDSDPATERWSQIATLSQEAVINLSGYTLSGLRATSTLMASGEVIVMAGAR